jgi:hypothetical protein
MVHIVWHGKGFLVLVFVFGFSLAANCLCNAMTGSGVYWSAHKWPFAISLFASGSTCWLVGRYLHSRKARLLIDPKTGEKIVLRYSHSFFYIPMMWWGPVLVGFGVIALLMDIVK